MSPGVCQFSVGTAPPHLVGNLRCLAVHKIERGSEWQMRAPMTALLAESGGMCRDVALHKVTLFKDAARWVVSSA